MFIVEKFQYFLRLVGNMQPKLTNLTFYSNSRHFLNFDDIITFKKRKCLAFSPLQKKKFEKYATVVEIHIFDWKCLKIVILKKSIFQIGAKADVCSVKFQYYTDLLP